MALLRHCVDRGFVGDVGFEPDRFAPGGGDLRRDSLGPVAVAVGQDDLGALLGEA